MKLNGKVVNLNQLETELTAAGIAVNALGTTGDDLHTYASGVPFELAEGAAAVVAAHVPAVPVFSDPDADLDAAITASTTFAQLKAALLAGGGRVKARPVA